MSALRFAVGATSATAVASRVMALASSILSGAATTLVGPRRSAPGETMSRLVPMLAMSAVIFAVAPRPSVTMAITEATPMTMPSVVSTERIVLRRTSRNAIRIVDQITPHLGCPARRGRP